MAAAALVGLAAGCGDAPLPGLHGTPAQPPVVATVDTAPGVGRGSGLVDESDPVERPPSRMATDEPGQGAEGQGAGAQDQAEGRDATEAGRLGVDSEPGAEPSVCHEALTRYPIVLCHGMGGFDQIGPLEYWAGVPAALEAAGARVFVTEVDWLNGSDVRGGQLAAQLDEILALPCVTAVNLVAHSQGGIDARYVVDALGYSDVVASITTIGTPHGGLWLSDVGLGLADGPQAAVLDAFAGLFDFAWPAQAEDPDVQAALWWTSTTGMAAFAQEVPEAPAVARFSWAGVTGVLTPTRRAACAGGEVPVSGWGDVVSPLLVAQYTLSGGALAATDGLVGVETARWGRFRGCVTADHLDEIGQAGGLAGSFDHLRFYEEIVGFLAAEGL